MNFALRPLKNKLISSSHAFILLESIAIAWTVQELSIITRRLDGIPVEGEGHCHQRIRRSLRKVQ